MLTVLGEFWFSSHNLSNIFIDHMQVFAQHRVFWSVLGEETSSVLTSRSPLSELGRSARDEAENKTTWSWEAIVPGLALLIPQLLLIFHCRYSPWLSKYFSPWCIPVWGWGAIFLLFFFLFEEDSSDSFCKQCFSKPCFHTVKCRRSLLCFLETTGMWLPMSRRIAVLYCKHLFMSLL